MRKQRKLNSFRVLKNLFAENAKYFAESGLPGLSLLECLDEQILRNARTKNMEKKFWREKDWMNQIWKRRIGRRRKWIGLPFSVLPTRQSAPLLPHLMLILSFTVFVGQTLEYIYVQRRLVGHLTHLMAIFKYSPPGFLDTEHGNSPRKILLCAVSSSLVDALASKSEN